jgi:hypothetical protein
MTAAVKWIKAAAARNDKTQRTKDHNTDNSLKHAHSVLLSGKGPANVFNACAVWALTDSGRIAVKME